MEKHNISLLNDYYGCLLTERQKKMLELFYNEDMSLSEIANQFSVSRQAVRDAVLRGEKSLLEFEKKLGLASTHQKALTLLEEIESATQGRDFELIRNLAEKIKGLLEE